MIKAKTVELQNITKALLVQKKEKDQLITENKSTQKDLEKERKQHQHIMVSIQKELSKYTAQIRAKQREADKIDSAIDRIIKAAIAKSKVNKKAKTTTATTTGFALTPEEKILSNNFTSNKGKLPWPVENGYVSLGYGTQPHPINKTLTIKSNGVRITTKGGAKVRAVFDGKVMSIVRLKNVNPIVMIQHGNYITTYKNLSKLYVKEGDVVKTKQVIGDVATNNFTGKTTLSFIVSKGSVTQNPKSWIYKM
jgi:septal ring factor EnvC (AmiA/AmiB activator)